MKIGIYASNNASTLKKILSLIKKDFPEFIKCIEFLLIDNENNLELKKKSSQLGIKFFERNINIIQKKNKYISDELLNIALEEKVDYIFLFCDKILKGDILKKYKNRIINFHPALLPSFKGLLSIDQALETDVILLGNTAHFIDEEIDAGIMIMQSLFSRHNFKDYTDVLNLQIYMFIQLLEWLTLDRIKIQDKVCIVERATYEVSEFIPKLENEKLINLYTKK